MPRWRVGATRHCPGRARARCGEIVLLYTLLLSLCCSPIKTPQCPRALRLTHCVCVLLFQCGCECDVHFFAPRASKPTLSLPVV